MIVTNNVQLSYEQQVEKLKKACEDFESFFYKMIFKSSNTDGKNSLIKMSNADNIFRDMYQDKLSTIAAKKNEGGIKKILFNSLKDNLNYLKKEDLNGLNSKYEVLKKNNLEKNKSSLDLKI